MQEDFDKSPIQIFPLVQVLRVFEVMPLLQCCGIRENLFVLVWLHYFSFCLLLRLTHRNPLTNKLHVFVLLCTYSHRVAYGWNIIHLRESKTCRLLHKYCLMRQMWFKSVLLCSHFGLMLLIHSLKKQKNLPLNLHGVKEEL